MRKKFEAMTNEPSPSDYLSDPLSSLSRAERRNLLLASFVGLLISTAGLIPTRISAFGIELSAPQQNALTFAAVLIVAYFSLAFLAYAVPDWLVWRRKYQDHLEQAAIFNINWSLKDQHIYDEIADTTPNIKWLYRASPVVAYLRFLFDYILPLCFAGYSVFTLIFYESGA